MISGRVMLNIVAALTIATVIFETPGGSPHDATPSPELDARSVIDLSLSALGANDDPHPDAGVDVAWRFANGRLRAELGGYDGLRRAFHGPGLRPLIDHTRAMVEPTRESDDEAHVLVVTLGTRGLPVGFVFDLVREVGGKNQGCWMIAAIRRVERPTRARPQAPPRTEI